MKLYHQGQGAARYYLPCECDKRSQEAIIGNNEPLNLLNQMIK